MRADLASLFYKNKKDKQGTACVHFGCSFVYFSSTGYSLSVIKGSTRDSLDLFIITWRLVNHTCKSGNILMSIT